MRDDFANIEKHIPPTVTKSVLKSGLGKRLTALIDLGQA